MEKINYYENCFSFNDWNENKAQQFRNEVEKEILQNSLRDSLLVSEDLSNEGKSYYLLILDAVFGDKLKDLFFMEVF